MSNENQETIADIITEASGVFDELRKHGYTVVSVDRMADIIDRVEEAHKREREAGAEAAQICGEIGEMVGREASKNQSVTNCNRLGNASKMREALESFNAVDLSGFEFPLDGDSSTIYNSNKNEITIPYWRVAELLNGVKAAQDMSKAALSAPPRNCDVGTPEEQAERFQWFCDTRPCDCCTLKNKANETLDCAIHWAQMPYKEGENAEVKK